MTRYCRKSDYVFLLFTSNYKFSVLQDESWHCNWAQPNCNLPARQNGSQVRSFGGVVINLFFLLILYSPIHTSFCFRENCRKRSLHICSLLSSVVHLQLPLLSNLLAYQYTGLVNHFYWRSKPGLDSTMILVQ